jgi:hypothetical protein
LLGGFGEDAGPAADQFTYCIANLCRAPSRRDHLLQDADVAGVEVVFEVVAGQIPSLGERQVELVHVCLTSDQCVVLLAKHRQDQLFFRSEVVVDLRQRNSGLLGHASSRERGETRLQQGVARRSEDPLGRRLRRIFGWNADSHGCISISVDRPNDGSSSTRRQA